MEVRWTEELMRSPIRLFLAVLLLILGSYYTLGSSEVGFWPTTYKPSSPEIAALAIATTMTEDAQQLFYKQEPEIAPKSQFHSLCSKVQRNVEETVLLGCFTSDGYRGKIIIQSVTDSRLEGTMEVVAAHELLHAVYQKLSRREREDLEPRLAKAAKQVKDSFLLPVIESYREGDVDIYHNELHSYLGTELDDLGDPELEKHYQKYFSDRLQVVELSKRSRSTLTDLDSQAGELVPEIDRLETQLQQEESTLKTMADDLDYRANRLNELKSSLLSLQRQAEDALRNGDSSLVSQFESAQENFNAEVREYNYQVESHRNRVTQFNQDYEVYRQKIQSYNQLNQNKRDILDTLKPSNVNVSNVEPE
jgi:phage shock protein A